MRRVMISDGNRWKEFSSDPLQTEEYCWVDFESPTDEEFRLLEDAYRFHPLAVEDCRHLDQRSKVEDYGDHMFVVFHVYAPSGRDPTALILQELHCFITPRLLVTVRATSMAVLERLWGRAKSGDRSGARGPAGMLHEVLDAMVDEMFPVVESLTELVEDVTERIMVKADTSLLNRVLEAKRTAMEIRRLSGPAREVANILVHGGNGLGRRLISDAEAVYFRNVLDHLFVLQQMIDTCREFVSDARDIYLSAQANRVNEVVKRLSVMATLGLPFTVITGFFGMNFEGLPFAEPMALQGALAAMVLIPTSLLTFMRWRHWI